MSARTADGVELFVREWPAARRRGSLLLVHGLGEHSGRYAHVAAVLNEAGLHVRAYDQRGFGRSGGARATLPHPDALVDDAAAMFDALAAEARDAGEPPPFLLGHSMGGLVAARAVTGGRIAPRGLVLSSPALALRLAKAQRLGVRLGARLVPNLRVPHGLPLDRLSHDPRVLAEVRADPLAHSRATPRLVGFMLDAAAAVRRDVVRLRVPTLLLVAGDDSLVDPRGSRDFADAAPAGVVTVRWFDALYHETFNEREPDRSEVLEVLRRWVSETMERPRSRA